MSVNAEWFPRLIKLTQRYLCISGAFEQAVCNSCTNVSYSEHRHSHHVDKTIILYKASKTGVCCGATGATCFQCLSNNIYCGKLHSLFDKRKNGSDVALIFRYVHMFALQWSLEASQFLFCIITFIIQVTWCLLKFLTYPDFAAKILKSDQKIVLLFHPRKKHCII